MKLKGNLCRRASISRVILLAAVCVLPTTAAVIFDFSISNGGFTSDGSPAWTHTTAWTVSGSNANSTLTSPTLTAAGGAVTLEFSHTRNMEAGFDGGVIEFSVGAGPFLYLPNSAFTQNGYIAASVDAGVNTALGTTGIGSNAMFSGNVGNQVSILQLAANLNPGDQFRFRFHYASDPTISSVWTINSASVGGSQEIPEPATLLLVCTGVPAAVLVRRRRIA
jgi:hypothetical protein